MRRWTRDIAGYDIAGKAVRFLTHARAAAPPDAALTAALPAMRVVNRPSASRHMAHRSRRYKGGTDDTD